MVIKSIKSNARAEMEFVVGQGNIAKIELTEQGGEKTNIYKVTDDDGDYVFIGLLKESEVVEYE